MVQAKAVEPAAWAAEDGVERDSAYWQRGWDWIAEQRRHSRYGRFPAGRVDVLHPVSIAHSSAMTITRSMIGSFTSA